MLAPILTPHGRLLLEDSDDLSTQLTEELADRLKDAFGRGHGHGLLQLGAAEVQTAMPAVFAYWREFASRYVVAVRTFAGLDGHHGLPAIPPPSTTDLASIVFSAPAMKGSEYLSVSVLEALWADLDAAFRLELSESNAAVEDFLKGKNPAWNLVGRVHFNLAENRKDSEFPFAFLATYTHRLSSKAKAQHIPLGRALSEYAGAANKQRLLSLLLPVQRASEQSAWLKGMVDNGEIFHPLRWSSAEALQLLHDIPVLESAGVIVRVPSAWRGGRAARPRVTAKLGDKPPSGVGVEAILDFRMEVTLDGERLSDSEIATLLAGSSGLHFIRGRWVEIDRDRLEKLIDRFRTAERTAADQGLSFAYAMRLLSGAETPGGDIADEETTEWSGISAGEWLAETLERIRNPNRVGLPNPSSDLHARLRPYQATGVQWLHLLSQLGLGACLADDMGLGKTMQVLALLLTLRRDDSTVPSLLVAPASILANWVSEIERFAPTLKTIVAHPSATPAKELKALNAERVKDAALVITSYGSLLRIPQLLDIPWQVVVLDEAQAIKNPDTKQTRAVKRLRAQARIALTGTPIENKLGDLWSIFDFINPGLLGSGKQFTEFAKRLSERAHNAYGPLRDLVRPYVLRRLKTDKSVITDLPEKTEVKTFCQLTRKQAALYQEAVDELADRIGKKEEGIERRGTILSFLMRFKQICNHPSQWLEDGDWAEQDSGKLLRLREIVDVIAARQEKVLVFTQFREITSQLSEFLEAAFGRPGLVMHGETEVRKRQALVNSFQEDERIPFFVLSLKAGGAGLNLTAASHVIHFDRWWNPAVENQATDRAFRIGQSKNVLVHKFICRGTLEENIDTLIESKQQMSKDLFEGETEIKLTEMTNEELLKLVSLDIHRAAVE